MRWAWGMAAVVICAVGCGGGPKGGAKPPRPPDPVPASMPNAILHTPPPKLVPDTAFDYDYTTRYEWPNQNNRDYHLVVEHDCRILFIPTGGGKQRFATMQLSEFWALDANGQMDAHEVDRIRRAALAGQGITDAVECCNYHVHGVRVKSGLPVKSVALSFSETDAFRQADGNFYAEPSGRRGYYFGFEYSPPGRVDLEFVPGKDMFWSSRYRYRSSEQGNQKDVLELTDIQGGGVFGPDLPRGCDFPSEVRPPP